MIRMPRLAATALVAVAAIGLLAGCAGRAVAHPAPSATALPTGITAWLATSPETAPSIITSTSGQEAYLVVRNDTTQPIVINRVRIDDPRFLGLGYRVGAVSSSVAAGEEARIAVQLPEMICDETGSAATAAAEALTDASPRATPAATSAASATVSVGFALGAAVGVAYTPLDDPNGVLDSAYAAQCGAR